MLHLVPLPLDRLPLGALPLDTPAVVAQVQTDVLGRSLLIALVIVSPYGFYKWRQVARVRREREARQLAADTPPETGPVAPRLEDVIDEVARVAQAARGDGAGTIRIPHGVTVDGEPAPAALVDALVRDALRRSNLVATAEVETASARVIECTTVDAGPASGGAPR